MTVIRYYLQAGKNKILWKTHNHKRQCLQTVALPCSGVGAGGLVGKATA